MQHCGQLNQLSASSSSSSSLATRYSDPFLFLDSSKNPIASEDSPSSREETRSSSEMTERSRAASATRSSVNGTLLAIPLRAWPQTQALPRKNSYGALVLWPV